MAVQSVSKFYGPLGAYADGAFPLPRMLAAFSQRRGDATQAEQLCSADPMRMSRHSRPSGWTPGTSQQSSPRQASRPSWMINSEITAAAAGHAQLPEIAASMALPINAD